MVDAALGGDVDAPRPGPDAATTQPGELVWSKLIGGPDDDSAARAVAVSTAGDIYVAGSLEAHPWIARFTVDGELVWERTLDARGEARGIALDAAGAPHIVGTLRPLQAGEIFVRKYDPDGAEEWTYLREATGDDVGFAIDVTDDAVFVAGNVQPGGGGTQPYAYATQLSLDGSEVWFSSSAHHTGNGIAAHDDGSVVLTGSEMIESGNSVVATRTFMRKYNSQGNAVWTRTFPNDEDCMLPYEYALAATAYGAGDTIATGRRCQQEGVVPVYRLDGQGQDVWLQTYDEPALSYEVGNGIDVDGDGRILVAGFALTEQEGQNRVVREIDIDGDIQWTWEHDGDQDELAGIARHPDGDVVIVGRQQTWPAPWQIWIGKLRPPIGPEVD